MRRVGKPRIVYLNGRYVRADRARVSALDRGFLYADGVFETVRIYGGEPFALDEHLRRNRETARLIRLAIPGSRSWWRETIAGLLRRNGFATSDAAVRWTVTRGEGDDGLAPARRSTPTILLQARTIPAALSEWQTNGVAVTVLPFHPGTDGYLSGRKTVDYLTAAIGKAVARDRGKFEGIYRTPSGEILEGTTSNVFIVRGETIITPPASRGILPGITRDHVLRLAREERLAVSEASITLTQLETSDEAFLTASTIEIVPIREVDRQRLGCERPITRRLQGRFRATVRGARRRLESL